MALPIKKNEMYYKTTLPSGKKVEFRPWRVKDEKELLFAVEGQEDKDEILVHVLSFLELCIKGEDIKKMSPVDILAFAVEVYKKSKGEEVEIFYRCPHCNTKATDPLIMNLNNSVDVKKFAGEDFEIGDYTFAFKELSFKEQEALAKKYKDSLRKFKFYRLVKSLKTVIEDGESFNHFTDKEAEDFFDDMNPTDFQKLVEKFDDSYSDFSISKSIECLACHGNVNVYIKDICDFFV